MCIRDRSEAEHKVYTKSRRPKTNDYTAEHGYSMELLYMCYVLYDDHQHYSEIENITDFTVIIKDWAQKFGIQGNYGELYLMAIARHIKAAGR